MKRVFFFALAVCIGGYLYFGLPLPSSHTNDPRMSYVFAREGLGFASCVGYWEKSRKNLSIPLQENPNGPPGQLTISHFESNEVHQVASKLAEGRFDIVMPAISGLELRDSTNEEGCASDISQIVVVDDIALIHFSAPGGDIGVHAFHRGIFGWRAIERVHLGWW